MNTWWITAYAWRRWCAGICLAAGAWLGFAYLRLPEPDPDRTGHIEVAAPAWPEQTVIPASAWQVLQPAPADSPVSPDGQAAQRFRLAGTYFQFSEEGQLRRRTAYLEDTEKQQQYMLHENDSVDGLTLVHIYSNSVAVVYGGERATLRLSYQGQETEWAATSPPQAPGPKSYDDIPALETNRFGKRIGENRWVFKREALLAYQQELADDAERLAQLFVSFRPDGDTQEVAGYQLNIRGERDFFEQVGLQEKDIIREVNSMRMVSQKRAALFLREFSRNNLNMLVLDIERDGDQQKLIYLIR